MSEVDNSNYKQNQVFLSLKIIILFISVSIVDAVRKIFKSSMVFKPIIGLASTLIVTINPIGTSAFEINKKSWFQL